MKVIGITGGIGSGKSTISNMLREEGYTVFDSDSAAKSLCDNDSSVINDIKMFFGENIYVDGVLDRKSLANIVFNNKGSLDTLNAIVHPKTREYMLKYINDDQGELFFVESAIMFNSDLYKIMDKVILVTAPIDIRIQRIIKRDNITKDKIEKRMNNQMTDDELSSKSDYNIDTNMSLKNIEEKLIQLIKKIKET